MAITLDGSNLTTSGVINAKTAVASTSGTSIDFTIPIGATRITVMLSGVSTNGTSSLIIQIGDSGGIEGSGYISTAGAINSTSANATNQTAAFLIAATASAANTATGHAVLTNITGNTWVCSAVTRSGTLLCTYAAGDKTLSDVLTQIRVTSVSSDTFDAGTINVLYE